MWILKFIFLIAFISTSATAAESKCNLVLMNPSGWESEESTSGLQLHSPSTTGSIAITCMVLEKSLTDIEFGLFTGEEEPSEAPPLKELGEFRGRLGVIFPDQHREWFLIRDNVYIRVVLTSERKDKYKELVKTVGEVIETIKIVL